MFGVQHSNIGEQRNAQYLYSKEYVEPKPRKKSDVDVYQNDPNISEPVKAALKGDDGPHLVDIDKLTANEFKALYDKARKGEPDNKVNF